MSGENPVNVLHRLSPYYSIVLKYIDVGFDNIIKEFSKAQIIENRIAKRKPPIMTDTEHEELLSCAARIRQIYETQISDHVKFLRKQIGGDLYVISGKISVGEQASLLGYLDDFDTEYNDYVTHIYRLIDPDVDSDDEPPAVGLGLNSSKNMSFYCKKCKVTILKRNKQRHMRSKAHMAHK